MKYYILFIVSFLFGSCQYFEQQLPSEKELLQKELIGIDWKNVDEYPSLSMCEKLDDEAMRKQCFFDVMTQLIQEKLDVDTLAMKYPELDTIEVKVTIYPDSRLTFDAFYEKDSTIYRGLKMDSILKTKLVDFPKIQPAIKRGIPVKTQFVLPVIIQSE